MLIRKLLPRAIVALALSLACLAPATAAPAADPVHAYIAKHAGKAKAEAYAPLVTAKAAKYKLPPLLIAKIIKLESDFNPKETSHKDALGLMQIRRGHAKRGENLYDPATNLEFGCRILREYVDQFDGDLHRGLSAYLHGPIYVASRGVRTTRYSRMLLGDPPK
jgi:soluble lytic murein transglycosylase-like protein